MRISKGGQADRGGYVEMMGLYRLDAGPILTEE
jgi:hypothetical protein